MSLPTPEHPEDSLSDDANQARPSGTLTHRRSHETLDAPPRRWLKRLLVAAGILAFILIIVTITTAIALRHAMHASLPQLDGNLSIAGLSSPVTITRDAQGVPSIHAANLDDLLFAQGYITASDRLFQMDTLRRHGAGELAEILGPSLLQHDREQRTLQLRAAADRAIAVLPPDQLHQLQAYARGVNAFIDSHSAQKHSPSAQDDLPIEFHLLHYTPAPWAPSDSLLIALVMSQDLSTEFPTKLNREALSAHLPAALLADLYPTGSWRDHPPAQDPINLTAPAGTVEQIPLDNTQSSISPQTISPQNGCPIHDVASSRHEWAGDLLTTYTDLHSNQCEGCKAGSNNWAVAGTHTATGAPLLSNDMHLGLTAPDIWYEAALHADGPTPLDVTGFTLPGVPFVIAGRNPHVAWSFTNSGADVQDVLIEHLRGSGPNTEYEHPDHTWSPIGHQTENIHVRAGHDVTLDVLTTTHTFGTTSITTPIISPLYKSEHRALALAWTIYDPSTVTSPFLAIDTATDAASLVAAFADFSSVSLNLIYADAHHIGYHLLGRIPIRGPAIQRPRATQPFILPNTIPPEDEEDESGDDDPDASLIQPQLWQPQLWQPQLWVAHSSRGLSRDEWGLAGVSIPHLTSATWVPSHRSPFVLASATQTLSSRPERSAVERPAVPARATQTLSSRPERSAVERPAVPASATQPLSSRPERSAVERPAVLARATQTLSSRPERSAVERPAVLARATQTLSSRPERSAVERPAVPASATQTLSSRPERSAVERPAVLARATQPLSSRPERSAVERPAVLARATQTLSSRPERSAVERPAVLARATQTLSSRPERSAVERPAVLARATQTLSSRPERSAVERPAVLARATQTLSSRPERSAVERPAVLARATQTLSSRPERSAVERPAVLARATQTLSSRPERSAVERPAVLARATQTLSSRPERSAVERPAVLARATQTLSSRPERSAVERPAVLARATQTLSSRPERSAVERPAVLARATQTLSSRPERSAVERPAVLARATQTLSSRPERSAVERPAVLARATQTLSSRPERSAVERPAVPARATQTPPNQQELPTLPTTAYTIGSPISPIPVDALDLTQAWSGYIPYDALPSVLDPTSGILATANARIVTDVYPYFIANDWADAYRVERINHLLASDSASRNNLTPADMLHIQTDVHSEFDLLIAQRLAYALDHSALTKKDPRLHRAADLLRDWNGDVTANSSAAAIVAAARTEFWPMLLAPQIRAHDHPRKHAHNSLKLPPSAQDSAQDIIALYTWEEKDSALEQILQHTPTRWLPHAFANWNDFLTTALERGLHFANAPRNLSTWTYGSGHPVEIPHPIFGSHSPISTLLGVATGTGLHPNGGDATTIKAAGLNFGPSERFTADLSNPDDTHANITTGESGNPSSPWYLDQFLPWLNGTTFPLPLDHPTTTHTLTLNPK